MDPHWLARRSCAERGERPAAVGAAARALSIVQAHAVSTWSEGFAVILHAAGAAPVDVEALNALQHQMVAARIPTWRRVVSGCFLAGLYGEVNAPERGLEVLASLQDAARTSYYGSEIYRVEGELRRQVPSPLDQDAESYFQRAIDMARRRDAKSLELRATTSLARLWRDRGRRKDAHRVLADIYGWFTEGFDTQDLRTANALLPVRRRIALLL
jgi:hypothetical protein